MDIESEFQRDRAVHTLYYVSWWTFVGRLEITETIWNRDTVPDEKCIDDRLVWPVYCSVFDVSNLDRLVPRDSAS